MKIAVYAIDEPVVPTAITQRRALRPTIFGRLEVFAAAILILVGGGSNPSFAQDPRSSQPNGNLIAKSIRQLGAKSFIDREDATLQLISIGVTAEPLLVRSSDSADREIRKRSLRVLKLIRSRQRDILLAKFREQPNWNPGDQLPGWPTFSKRYGESNATRKIYADIVGEEWELIARCFNAENEFQRRDELMNRYHELSKLGLSYHNCQAGTAMAFFFLCSEQPMSLGNGLHQNLFNYLRNPGVYPLLTRRTNASVQQQDAVRALVGDWIISASEPSLNDRNARNALHNARIYQLKKAGQVVTERILTDPKSLATTKSNAMQSIVLRNDKSQISLLEPFLEDSTLLGTSPNKRVKQLRDISLACLMKLKGHDLSLIGATVNRSSLYVAFDYQTLGFITDGDRKKAFDTYKKLEAAKERQQP